eukprot:364388-Chlamydomonas_euryale.AAC.6
MPCAARAALCRMRCAVPQVPHALRCAASAAHAALCRKCRTCCPVPRRAELPTHGLKSHTTGTQRRSVESMARADDGNHTERSLEPVQKRHQHQRIAAGAVGPVAAATVVGSFSFSGGGVAALQRRRDRRQLQLRHAEQLRHAAARCVYDACAHDRPAGRPAERPAAHRRAAAAATARGHCAAPFDVRDGERAARRLPVRRQARQQQHAELDGLSVRLAAQLDQYRWRRGQQRCAGHTAGELRRVAAARRGRRRPRALFHTADRSVRGAAAHLAGFGRGRVHVQAAQARRLQSRPTGLPSTDRGTLTGHVAVNTTAEQCRRLEPKHRSQSAAAAFAVTDVKAMHPQQRRHGREPAAVAGARQRSGGGGARRERVGAECGGTGASPGHSLPAAAAATTATAALTAVCVLQRPGAVPLVRLRPHCCRGGAAERAARAAAGVGALPVALDQRVEIEQPERSFACDLGRPPCAPALAASARISVERCEEV